MELIVAFTIMLILTTMAVPLARSKVRAERERDLRYDLREMRTAIDKYKDYCRSRLSSALTSTDRLLARDRWTVWWKA